MWRYLQASELICADCSFLALPRLCRLLSCLVRRESNVGKALNVDEADKGVGYLARLGRKASSPQLAE